METNVPALMQKFEFCVVLNVVLVVFSPFERGRQNIENKLLVDDGWMGKRPHFSKYSRIRNVSGGRRKKCFRTVSPW